MTTAELLEHLKAQAMTLPAKERQQLVVELEESLGSDDGDVDVEVSPEFGAELERRVASIRSGTATLVPAGEFLADLRARLAAR